jgi:hypothetical protein
MRLLFSALMLLVVVAIVGKLAATQMQAVAPQGTPASAAQRSADMVTKAIEQGAAMRAADAASQ